MIEILQAFDLAVDWVIGYSGAVITDGKGKLISVNPFAQDFDRKDLKSIHYNGHLIQKYTEENLDFPTHFRQETYQGTTYISNWKASKLRAIHQLIQHIEWNGDVHTYGDGPYDREMLIYFNGVKI